MVAPNRILKRAIDSYGVDMQLNVAVEELSELIKEICKYKRGAHNLSEIIEEIADCEIMLRQLVMMFHISDLVITDEIDKKVKRLEHRLDHSQRKEDESNG